MAIRFFSSTRMVTQLLTLGNAFIQIKILFPYSLTLKTVSIVLALIFYNAPIRQTSPLLLILIHDTITCFINSGKIHGGRGYNSFYKMFSGRLLRTRSI